MLDNYNWRWSHYRYIDALEKDNSSDFYRWDKLLTVETSCWCGAPWFAETRNGERLVCQFSEHGYDRWIAIVISLLRWHEYTLMQKIIGEGYWWSHDECKALQRSGCRDVSWVWSTRCLKFPTGLEIFSPPTVEIYWQGHEYTTRHW